ncbi:MAG: hypothetical protein WHS83_18875 [Chloroflexus sp.]|nr:hypothetical protein [Chloroflexus aurantiacus]
MITADRIAVAMNFTPAGSRALVTTGHPIFATGLGGTDGYYVTMPWGR